MNPPPAELLGTAAIYRLAARTMAYEVDTEFLTALIGSNAALARPLSADLLAQPREDILISLAVEYCRLFIGPHPVCLLHPIDSVPEARRARGEMARIRRRYRLEIVNSTRAAGEDHLAVWLQMLSDLHRDAAASGGQLPPIEARTALCDIMASAAGKWLGATLRTIRSESHVGPYAPVAGLALAAMRSISKRDG